jgi:hypothetical protein
MPIAYNGFPVGEGALDPPTSRPRIYQATIPNHSPGQIAPVQFFRNAILARWI